MSSFYELDVSYTKKKEGQKKSFLDKRKFRGQQSEYDKTIKILMETFDFFGISDSIRISTQLMSIKIIYQLNKNLLVLTYLYFRSKGFDLSNTFLNFDEDFQQLLNDISKYGIFKKLFEKKLEYTFRQDFIMYLFILNQFKEEMENSEISSESYESYLDETSEDVYQEDQKPPQDNLDYTE